MGDAHPHIDDGPPEGEPYDTRDTGDLIDLAADDPDPQPPPRPVQPAPHAVRVNPAIFTDDSGGGER